MRRAGVRASGRHRASDPPAAWGGRVRDVVVAGVRDVTRLVLPVECPGCGRWDVRWCDACVAALDGPVRRCEERVPRLDRLDGTDPLPVWTAADYVGPVRGLVLAWKDRDRADLTRLMVGAAQRVGAASAVTLGAAAAGEPVHLVPVPSSPAARRRRGADLVRELAEGAAQGLREHGVVADVLPLLSRRRGGRDQVGLGVRARGRNTAGSVRLRPSRARWTAGSLHVLVDDVVTTGSTLVACERVLSGSGGLVLGALVLAATPPPSDRDVTLLSEVTKR